MLNMNFHNVATPSFIVLSQPGHYIAARHEHVIVGSGCELEALEGSEFIAQAGSTVEAYKGSHGKAMANSHVHAFLGASVIAENESDVRAYSGSRVMRQASNSFNFMTPTYSR